MVKCEEVAKQFGKTLSISCILMWVLLPSQNFYSQGYGKYISKKKEKYEKNWTKREMGNEFMIDKSSSKKKAQPCISNPY